MLDNKGQEDGYYGVRRMGTMGSGESQTQKIENNFETKLKITLKQN